MSAFIPNLIVFFSENGQNFSFLAMIRLQIPVCVSTKLQFLALGRKRGSVFLLDLEQGFSRTTFIRS